MENYYDHGSGTWVTAQSRFDAVTAQPRYRALEDAAREDPERAWPLVLGLIAELPDDLLPLAGCGPVHTLIEHHAAAFMDRIEAQAAADPRFRAALFEVLLGEGELPPALEARLVRAAGPGFWLYPRVDEDARE